MSDGLARVEAIDRELSQTETMAGRGRGILFPVRRGAPALRKLPENLSAWVAEQRKELSRHRRKVAGLKAGRPTDLQMEVGEREVVIRSRSGLFRPRHYGRRYFEAALLALGKRYPRREEVIRWYYGIGVTPLGVRKEQGKEIGWTTMEDIARLYGVSRQRLSDDRDRGVQILMTMLAMVDELAHTEAVQVQEEVAAVFVERPHDGGEDAWVALKEARAVVAAGRRVRAERLMKRLGAGTVTKVEG